ncbi:MAG: septum site-determining protein MinC [Cardiobacteriaceae bacterium]|nr:septum site-determining protein MinC [Cardiobacteriaceae bacterium]
MSDPLPFKGRSAGITAVLLQEADTAQIDEKLSNKLAQVPADFFATQPLVADLSALQDFHPDEKWLKTLKRIFERQKLSLIGISGKHIERNALIAAGLAEINGDNRSNNKTANKPTTDKPREITPPTIAPSPSTPAISVSTPKATKIIRHNIRSGQRIYAEGGDLIIIGTVSHGAEIYADGNISVYGALRGRAFAGGQNNTSACIYCHELEAELISIAGFYQDMEQLQANNIQKNVFIYLNPDESMQIVSV